MEEQWNAVFGWRSLPVWTQMLFHASLSVMCCSSESFWPQRSAGGLFFSGYYLHYCMWYKILEGIVSECECSEACGGSRPVTGGGFALVWCIRRVAKEGNVEREHRFWFFPCSVRAVTPKTKLNCKWGTSVRPLLSCFRLFSRSGLRYSRAGDCHCEVLFIVLLCVPLWFYSEQFIKLLSFLCDINPI